MVVEDVGSSQRSPSIRLLELASENFSVSPVIFRLRSCREMRKRRGWRIRSQSVLKLHALLPIWVYSCLLLRLYQGLGECPTPGKGAAITADEADEYVDVVRSGTSVHSDMEPEWFTFRKSVSHAFLKDLGGVLDTSGLPLFKF